MDLATVLDGYAYHTTHDRPDRMQAGAMQSMGDNAVALIPALAAEMLRQVDLATPLGVLFLQDSGAVL